MKVSFGTFDGHTTALLLFLFAICVVLIASVVLVFHWRHYGMGGKLLSFVEFIYLAGVLTFLLLAFVSMP